MGLMSMCKSCGSDWCAGECVTVPLRKQIKACLKKVEAPLSRPSKTGLTRASCLALSRELRAALALLK